MSSVERGKGNRPGKGGEKKKVPVHIIKQPAK